jgi:hypothetical protein
MIAAVMRLSIYGLALSTLPSAYNRLIVLELNLCNNVMSCCGLIAQLAINSLKQGNIF